jgi:hypothetical protein
MHEAGACQQLHCVPTCSLTRVLILLLMFTHSVHSFIHLHLHKPARQLRAPGIDGTMPRSDTGAHGESECVQANGKMRVQANEMSKRVCKHTHRC